MNMFNIFGIPPRNLRSSFFKPKISSRNVKLLYLENKARTNDYTANKKLEKELELIAKNKIIFAGFIN